MFLLTGFNSFLLNVYLWRLKHMGSSFIKGGGPPAVYPMQVGMAPAPLASPYAGRGRGPGPGFASTPVTPMRGAR